ncbi:hypothetical protein DWS77_08000 [Escherichia coli]|nr:hypothetical protein [Escherichia coli]EFD0542685.1 hypothetical protein [Escherichia coli]EFD0602474.1 hypothetical protein [Escherichia coli]EFE7485359.1 hypothetical protein [Escherichia coli]EFI4098605.1 hypothetical protein [Escherichia coli]
MDNCKEIFNLFTQVYNRHRGIDSCGIALSCSLLFHDFHLKKMPGRTGRMINGVPSLAGDAGFTAQRHRNGVLL